MLFCNRSVVEVFLVPSKNFQCSSFKHCLSFKSLIIAVGLKDTPTKTPSPV